MYTLRKLWTLVVLMALVFTACDPNKELYDTLDAMKKPYSEQLAYTLVGADYDRFRGDIEDYKAFSDSFPPADFIPDVLAVRFPTLLDGSTAQVTYNYLLLHPAWWDAGFGYQLQDHEYEGMAANQTFTPSNLARHNLPSSYLRFEYPNASEGDMVSIVYNFTIDGETFLYLDTYIFTNGTWQWVETIEDIPYVGYELQPEDYAHWPETAQFNNFSEENPPEKYLPILLRNSINPMAVAGTEQVVKYRYYDGSQNQTLIDKYHYNGEQWNLVPVIEQRTDQYIRGDVAWAFDPTVRFELSRDDYLFISEEFDPIPHETFADFGYYYGASAYYSNFDIRLIGRRLNKDDDGNYRDPELGAIYESEGSEAAMEEILRRINEEAIVKLLQHKFPDATPQVEGIDVHFFVSYETFADNWVRRYPVSEYICTAAGNPPQFEYLGPADENGE